MWFLFLFGFLCNHNLTYNSKLTPKANSWDSLLECLLIVKYQMASDQPLMTKGPGPMFEKNYPKNVQFWPEIDLKSADFWPEKASQAFGL